jgi:hypothetical protein
VKKSALGLLETESGLVVKRGDLYSPPRLQQEMREARDEGKATRGERASELRESGRIRYILEP